MEIDCILFCLLGKASVRSEAALGLFKGFLAETKQNTLREIAREIAVWHVSCNVDCAAQTK